MMALITVVKLSRGGLDSPSTEKRGRMKNIKIVILL